MPFQFRNPESVEEPRENAAVAAAIRHPVLSAANGDSRVRRIGSGPRAGCRVAREEFSEKRIAQTARDRLAAGFAFVEAPVNPDAAPRNPCCVTGGAGRGGVGWMATGASCVHVGANAVLFRTVFRHGSSGCRAVTGVIASTSRRAARGRTTGVSLYLTFGVSGHANYPITN